jgi:hypothetical protein
MNSFGFFLLGNAWCAQHKMHPKLSLKIIPVTFGAGLLETQWHASFNYASAYFCLPNESLEWRPVRR